MFLCVIKNNDPAHSFLHISFVKSSRQFAYLKYLPVISDGVTSMIPVALSMAAG